MLETAAGERSFAVMTTTPGLVASVEATYGHSKTFCGVALTKGAVHKVISDPRHLTEAP